jgi:Putative zinc-finger
MTCGELEILLSDYLDGVLNAADVRSVESHLETCPACAELARDAKEAIGFMERAAEIEPPPQLTARILAETGSGRHGRLGKPLGIRAWLVNLLGPVLQPRLAMGMAMTILSFSLMARCAGVSPRELRATDLEPAKIWGSLDDRAHRYWERSVKFYEDIKIVYEIQSQLRDWAEQQEEEDRNAKAQRPVEERRVPVSTPPPGAVQEPSKTQVR